MKLATAGYRALTSSLVQRYLENTGLWLIFFTSINCVIEEPTEKKEEREQPVTKIEKHHSK